MSTDAENKQRLMIAIGALVVIVAVTAGSWMWSSARTAASDRANLAAQKRAIGTEDPAEMRRQMLSRMAVDLGLTEAQKISVGKLQDEMWAESERSRPQGNGDREKMRAQMDILRQKQETRMAEILTQEQFATWKETRQRFGPGMGRRGRGGPGMGGPGGRMAPPGGMRQGGPPGGMFPGGMPPGGPPPEGGLNGPGGSMPPNGPKTN